MPNNNRLRRIYNLKKKSKEQEEKAYEYGDGYHQDMPGTTPKQDKKMMRHMEKSEKASAKAEKLWRKEKSKDEPTDYNLYGKGGYELKKRKSPFGYTAPVDSFAIVEEEESAPIKYVMEGAKFKEQSPNQAFSSKDFHLIQKLQGNYKEPSEGNFKTKSQNIYASFDSPLGWMVKKAGDPQFTNPLPESEGESEAPLQFRAPSELSRRDSGPSRAKYALAAADRITEQNQQGFNNALAGIQAGLTVASAAFGAPGATGWLGKKG
tara:strand:+ start:837 stop:1628 length:792 start_codon:yes stop_codon:yes gene_type:complete